MGLSDQQIEKRLSADNKIENLLTDVTSNAINTEDPILKEAMLYANRGLDAQQDANNFRTVSDLCLAKSIVWLPLGKQIFGSKLNIGDKVAFAVDRGVNRSISAQSKFALEEVSKKSIASRAADQGAKGASFTRNEVINRYERIYGMPYKNSSFSKSVSSGYSAGVKAGAAMGFGMAGQHLAGATTAAVNGGLFLARTQLPQKYQRLLYNVERFGARKYQKVYDAILKDHDFAKLALAYGYK